MTTKTLYHYSAKSDGYHAQRENLRRLLVTLYDEANENFWLLRDTDPSYQDPRTDYLLGKRDAITDLISYLDKTMAGYGTTTITNLTAIN